MNAASTTATARQLPMFPLQRVLLPSQRLVLHVFEPRYRVLVRRCLDDDRRFGVVLISRGSEVGGGDERSGTGTCAVIEDLRRFDDGRVLLAVRGTERLSVRRWLPDDPHPVAEVTEASDRDVDPRQALGALAEAEGALRRARALLSELGGAPALPEPLELPSDPVAASWLLAALAPLGPFDAQALLEDDDVVARARHLAAFMGQLADDVARGLSTGSPPA